VFFEHQHHGAPITKSNSIFRRTYYSVMHIIQANKLLGLDTILLGDLSAPISHVLHNDICGGTTNYAIMLIAERTLGHYHNISASLPVQEYSGELLLRSNLPIRMCFRRVI
jgi:hypothetical protein